MVLIFTFLFSGVKPDKAGQQIISSMQETAGNPSAFTIYGTRLEVEMHNAVKITQHPGNSMKYKAEDHGTQNVLAKCQAPKVCIKIHYAAFANQSGEISECIAILCAYQKCL